jgi:HK97 gp10 family phage protein
VIDFQIKGLADIERTLETLPDKIHRNVLTGGLRAGAKVMALNAKERVHSRSGLLAKSIRYGVTRTATGLMAYIRAGRVGSKAAGFRVWWAHMVEGGTIAHIIRARRGGAMILGGRGGTPVKEVQHPGARARPFMRPALDTQARNAVERAAEYMRNRLRTKHGIDIADPTPLDQDETP